MTETNIDTDSMSKLELIRLAKDLYSQSRLGDMALIKCEIANVKARANIEQQLKEVRGYLPEINIEELLKLPIHTFGHIYANHMKTNRLTPFNISPEFQHLSIKNVFAVRYVVTHDIFHVLLEFDTSWAGELGVLAFAAAQDYTWKQKLVAFPLALILYPIFAPTHILEIFTACRKGWKSGKKAKFLLGIRFEEMWEQPIDEIRSQLGLSSQIGMK